MLCSELRHRTKFYNLALELENEQKRKENYYNSSGFKFLRTGWKFFSKIRVQRLTKFYNLGLEFFSFKKTRKKRNEQNRKGNFYSSSGFKFIRTGWKFFSKIRVQRLTKFYNLGLEFFSFKKTSKTEKEISITLQVSNLFGQVESFFQKFELNE